jgi:dTDP-4-amino-4,6-dideoxy-D-galactose acyltransferase
MFDLRLKIKKIDWDSDFFNMNIGELALSKLEEISQFTLNDNFDLIYITAPFELGKTNKFSYCGTKIDFCKNLESCIIYPNNYSDILKIDVNYYQKFEKELKELAYLSGHYSRFFKDPLFKKSDFKKLYDKWLENAINKTHDNVFLVCHDSLQNIPCALLTGTIKELVSTARVGLFAVHGSHQGKGLGKKLLHYFEQLAINSRCDSALVPTQKENLDANCFYEALGYFASPTQFIYHYWK